MTPVIIGGATLFNCDCMEYMAGLKDKAFDLAIVDPPYGIGFDGQDGCDKTSRIFHANKGWDSTIPPPEYFNKLRRVANQQIIWGGNYMSENLIASSCWLIWDKMQEFSGATFEMAWTSFKTPAKAFRMSRVEAYTRQEKIHPTQKPVALYEWLLTNYAKPGQTILDTHLGSGSSAIAANNLGFEFVGCELDADYFAAACQRIENAQRQATLFAPATAKQEQIGLAL